MRLAALASVAVLAAALPALAVGPNNALNDTGITKFGDDTRNDLATEPATHPRQDGSRGRDAAAAAGALTKVGGGIAGFDFTKIANNGSTLPAGAALGTGPGDWGCTYDNVTGLLWEVKSGDASQLRYKGHTYTWYDTNPSTNGGGDGIANGGACKTPGRCDTEKFVVDVNAAGLCGHNDWRMPHIGEVESLVNASIASPGPTIDAGYFPNTATIEYWSGTAWAGNIGYAWYVGFADGYVDFKDATAPVVSKAFALPIRVVRSGR